MKFTEFLTGTEQEKQAVQTLNELPKKGLAHSQVTARDQASPIYLRLRARQLITGVVGLAGLGLGVATFTGDEMPELETTQTAAMTERVSETAATEEGKAKKSLETPTPELETFEAGGFQFVINEEFTTEEIARIKSLTEAALPEIYKYIPKTENLGKRIQIKKIKGKVCVSNYHTGELLLGDTYSDGLFVHELVHLAHGTKDTPINLLEEGTAVAVSHLVTEELDLNSWFDIENIQINDTLRDGGMSIRGEVPYEFYQPLMKLRYYFSGKLWLDMEAEHPGFIRAFQEGYYAHLDAGNDKRTLVGNPFIEIGDSINQDLFRKALASNPATRFAKNRPRRENLLYTHYVHIRSNNRRHLVLHTVSKDQMGAEKGFGGQQIQFMIENLDTGQTSGDLMVITKPSGEAVIDLMHPSKGDVLKSWAGEGSRYKVTIQTPLGINEEFEFDYI